MFFFNQQSDVPKNFRNILVGSCFTHSPNAPPPSSILTCRRGCILERDGVRGVADLREYEYLLLHLYLLFLVLTIRRNCIIPSSNPSQLSVSANRRSIIKRGNPEQAGYEIQFFTREMG